MHHEVINGRMEPPTVMINDGGMNLRGEEGAKRVGAHGSTDT
jgi:hypothetical protein